MQIAAAGRSGVPARARYRDIQETHAPQLEWPGDVQHIAMMDPGDDGDDGVNLP
jgi:hypothetical protein